MDATTSNGSNIQSAKPSPPSVNPTFPEISAKLMKRETLNAYVSKANKRRQQRKKNKELAAAEDAEFEKMLQEAMEQDKLKQQEEYNDFSNSLQFYIDRHSDYRNKHFALRKHKTENIIGVQQCIVDFYRNRCVFEVASLVESPLVLNFFNAKMMELKGEHDGRIFHLLDSLVPLISSTPIVQQDLYWLYETRNKKSWSENALELYKFILYTPSMITSEIRWFTAQEIETYLPSLENGGYRQYESFARYLNRNIQMRAKKQNNPFGVSQPVCEFEKYINDEYFDCTEVDLKWTRARSKRFANLIVSPFKSSKPEQWRNCSNLFKELVKLESDIIDYDFSKLYGFDEDLELAVIGYCGLLSGTISSDPENWHEDFVLITPTERDSTDPL